MKQHSEHGPEIFLGLVGPVGVDLRMVTDLLSDALRRVRYKADPLIHLAHLLPVADEKWKNLPQSPLDLYIKAHIDAGDQLRESTQLYDAMAILGIGAIRKERPKRKKPNAEAKIVPRRAFIIRSLKHPDEVQTLRHVYGESFYLLAVHASHHERVQHLAKQIAVSRGQMGPADEFLATAEELIKLDLEELDKLHGQNLRNTFHRADVFFDVGRGEAALKRDIDRFVEVIFGNLFITPTKPEYAMVHAAAAALRSAEPGRQVGAAIATDDGDIVAVGTNEVPKSHGGLYWCDDEIDRRQFQLKEETNQLQKRLLVKETIESLRQAGWLRQDLREASSDALLAEAMDGKTPALPRRTQIRAVIEFGRAVHAEMAALIDAARRGVSVQNTRMYVTTFPCHLCARHIVAAGIKEVRYIEPYPRSLARDLYPDSIALERADRAAPVETQILFEPFVGISPWRYFDLFTAIGRRGADDSLNLFDPHSALPRFSAIPRIYLQKEKLMHAKLQARLHSQGNLFQSGTA